MADELNNELDKNGDYHRELNNLKADLAVLRGDMGNLVSNVVELTRQGAGSVKQKASAELNNGLDHLNSTYESFRREGQKAAETVQKRVEEHPLQSVLLALGAGLLLGHLMAHDDRH